MVVIFSGMLLFFQDDLSFDGLLGNVFGVLGGVMMAVMILCMRRQKQGVPAYTVFLGNMIGAVVGMPFLVQEAFTPLNLGIILYLGTFQIGLSFVLYAVAIKYVHALESTIIVTLEPILSPVWVFLVLGEIPGPYAIAGGILVVGGVVARAVVSTRWVPDLDG
jgi:drug/metabolite transporter (DMT)-like permease